MIRRLWCACLGAALALPALLFAKPPDLPNNPTITLTPREPDITCPYLRQQQDRPAGQVADAKIGRDVLDNLERLRKADDLLELAKELANDGYLAEAMECCDLAEELCPGSPSAARAVDTMMELVLGLVRPVMETEEAAEQESETPANASSQGDSFWGQLFQSMGLPVVVQYYSPEPSDRVLQLLNQTEPGVEPMVCGLMKACHLLMNQGQHHQAAELARQAYALDPQRVLADPLVYKMHLLAEPLPAGSSEASEPPTCPYCPSAGKPIRAIVPEKKKRTAKPTARLLSPLECELTEAEGDLRLSGDCSLGGNVYHLRYRHGSLAIWKTPDAGKSN